jgi:hypothetical protein
MMLKPLRQSLHIHDRQIRQTVSGEFLQRCRKNPSYANQPF